MVRSPVAERIVRLTLSRRYDGHEVPHLTLVAGYLDDGKEHFFALILDSQNNRGCWLCSDCEFDADCREWTGNEE